MHRIAELFNVPTSQDVVIRKFAISSRPPARAFIVYIEGLAEAKEIQRQVLDPLMTLARTSHVGKKGLDVTVLNELISAPGAERKETMEEVVAGVLLGETALFVGIAQTAAFLIDVKNPPGRNPTEPVLERTLRGPQLGFVERHRVSTAMIRAYLRDPDLIVEDFVVGRRSRTLTSMVYVRDIANPKVVAEMRRRLTSLDVDVIVDAGVLEGLLRDHAMSPIPTVLATERPDRAALQISQGAVALLVDGSTQALVVPVTYSTFIHSVEDTYLHFSFAVFLRVLRLAGLTVSTLLPGIYIAITNFHNEMLPAPLLLTISAAREGLPLPLVFEVLFMELSFELIREAGVRIPSPLGPTIGIVGALLIGDAAVSASLISPIIVIITALGALANFVLPEQSTASVARVGRFVFVGLASSFGLYGIALGLFAAGIHLASIRSFGVPFLSPIGAWRPGSLDVILRGPIWDQEKRPVFLRPLDLIRQARYARGWDPGVPRDDDARAGDSGQ